MTKNALVADIAKATGLHQTVVKQIVQLTLDGITEILVREGRVELRNFGVFQVRRNKPRLGRNPGTGEAVQVPARRSVAFKPGLTVRARLNTKPGRKSGK